MKLSRFVLFFTGMLLATITVVFASENIATLRNETAIDTQKEPGAIPKINNDDVRRGRAYPMQPPLIPHKIDNYQVDVNVNKCMSCHSRHGTQESQAPMVSVTHYMDRDGNFLAEISPRRYFCNQCHVVQHDAEPLVENQFVDMYELIKQKHSESDNGAEDASN